MAGTGTLTSYSTAFRTLGSGWTYLMTDGTILHNPVATTTWVRWTPGPDGNYANGTWANAATSNYTYEYQMSVVFANGKLLMNASEYPSTLQCEIFDPVANGWTICSPFETGDIAGIVLPNNTCWAGGTGKTSAITAESPINWVTQTPCPYGMDEISMALMPDGSIFCVLPDSGAPFNISNGGASSSGRSLRYYSNTNTWVECGAPSNQIVYRSLGQVGPAALMPNGSVFVVSGYANGGTAIWTPDGTTSGPGTWTDCPVIPNGAWCAQGPAAVLPNGHLLFTAGTLSVDGGFASDSSLYEWDGTSITIVPYNEGGFGVTFGIGLLNLPNGQCLVTEPGGWWLYTPAALPQTSPPLIATAPTTVLLGGTYTISGQLFNGLTAGSNAGSFYQNATNYPLVSLSSNGKTYYCRTHDHSTMGVATGTQTVSTNFDVPGTLSAGIYSLRVIANGIASAPVSINVGATNLTTHAARRLRITSYN